MKIKFFRPWEQVAGIFILVVGFLLSSPAEACPMFDPSAPLKNIARADLVVRGKIRYYEATIGYLPRERGAGGSGTVTMFTSRFDLDTAEAIKGAAQSSFPNVLLPGAFLTPETVKLNVIVGLKAAMSKDGQPIMQVVASTCGSAMMEDTPENVRLVREAIEKREGKAR